MLPRPARPRRPPLSPPPTGRRDSRRDFYCHDRIHYDADERHHRQLPATPRRVDIASPSLPRQRKMRGRRVDDDRSPPVSASRHIRRACRHGRRAASLLIVMTPSRADVT